MTELALVDRVRQLPRAQREALYREIGAEGMALLRWEWMRFWSRPDQRPPAEPWTYWMPSGGRGSGKTRCAVEWYLQRVRDGESCRAHLMGATLDSARSILIDGDSGILAHARPGEVQAFVGSVGVGGELRFTNGARALIFGAEDPEALRGPQCDTLLADDLAAWGVRAKATWDMAMLGFRLGDPKCCIPTTPKDVDVITHLLDSNRKGLIITRSSTDDNKGNLAPSFFDDVLTEFAGTDLEQQERYGVLVKGNKSSPFDSIDFGSPTIRMHPADVPPLDELVVALDPTTTATARSDECGIIVMGRAGRHLYLLEDLSGMHRPEEWGRRVVCAYEGRGATRIVAEENRGGGMVKETINAAYLRLRMERGQRGDGAFVFRGVVARDGKMLRAGPVRQLYLNGMLHHVGVFPALEKQMREWDPGGEKRQHDDRIDALVYAALDLADLGTGPRTGYHTVQGAGRVGGDIRASRLEASGEEVSDDDDSAAGSRWS